MRQNAKVQWGQRHLCSSSRRHKETSLWPLHGSQEMSDPFPDQSGRWKGKSSEVNIYSAFSTGKTWAIVRKDFFLLLGPEHKVNRVGILLSMQINRMDLRTQSRNNISVWIKYVLDNSSTTSTAAPCVSISVTVKGRTFNNFLLFKKIFVCVFL